MPYNFLEFLMYEKITFELCVLIFFGKKKKKKKKKRIGEVLVLHKIYMTEFLSNICEPLFKIWNHSDNNCIMRSILKTEKRKKIYFRIISTAQHLMHDALNDHVMANLCPEYIKWLRNIKLESLKLLIRPITKTKNCIFAEFSWNFTCGYP